MPEIQAIQLHNWFDCGSLNLQKGERICSSEYAILEKENEAIWFRNNRVVFSTFVTYYWSFRTSYDYPQPYSTFWISRSCLFILLVSGSTFEIHRHPGRLLRADLMQSSIWSNHDYLTDSNQLQNLARLYQTRHYQELNITQRFEQSDGP